MDLIRRYLVQIKSQLVGLTISQKLLIGLLAVFMIATIFFTVIWSAKPSMVALIPTSMSAEEINKVEIALKGKHEYQVSGDKILVPTEDAYAIRGELMAADALPKNLSSAFQTMIRDSSPFTTDAMNTRAWNNALQMELTKWLREFPYVQDGTVIIAMGREGGLGRAAMPSTASVLIKTKGGSDISSGQLLSIVDWVAGTVSGLKRENINVIVNGQRTYRGPDDNTAMPTNVLEVKKSIEDNLEAKLAKMFASMGDVKIAVNVTPDLSVRHRQSTTYDPKGTVSKPRQETNRETSTVDGTAAGGEPGAVPNASANVADTAPAGRKSTSTTSDVHTDNVVMIGQTFLDEVLPAGTEWKEMTASISLPRSYFVSLYHKRGGDDKTDPDDKKLNDLGIIDQEIKSATARAKNSIGAKSNDQIQVDWYDDTIMAKNAEVVMASSAFAAGNMPAIMQYAKQGVLALIALGAMGMMLMMVRKAVPAGGDSEIDAGVFIAGGKKGKRKGGGGANLEQFETIDDVFGEANQGEAVLTGIELDDETLASRKMVDEVSTMIKENPENAATLVKRWMTKNK